MKKILSLILAILTITSFSMTSIQNVSADSNGLLVPTRHRAYCTLTKTEQAEIEKEANKLLENAPLKGSNLEKLMFARKRFRCIYSLVSKNRDSAYGAIVLKGAVCSGLADGMSYLLDKLNVPNIVVGADKIEHAWNLVKMDDGKWYHFDYWVGHIQSEQECIKEKGNEIKSSDIVCDDDRGMIKKKYRAQTKDVRKIEKTVPPYLGVDNAFLDVDGYFYYVESITAKEYNEGKYPKLCRWRNGKSEVVADAECMANYFKDEDYRESYGVYDKCGDVFEIGGWLYNIKTRERSYIKELGAIHKNIYSVDIKPTYSEYGTNNYVKCSDCGYIFTHSLKKGSYRVEPLPLTAKPVVKYSKGKKSVNLKFKNEYYAEKWCSYTPSGGYQLKWRKVGEKRWKNSIRLSAKKQINRTIKSLKSKKKYQFKVRYCTHSGYGGYAGRSSGPYSYGPWSSVKTIKAK